MKEITKILRENIESNLKKCEQFEVMIQLFAEQMKYDLFSVNRVPYIIEDHTLYRLDCLFAEDCVIDKETIKKHLQRYINEDYLKFKTEDLLRHCYKA